MNYAYSRPEGSSLYNLKTGGSLISLSAFSSPGEEYRAAFEDKAMPFLYYYALKDGAIQRQLMTRGEFLTLARRGAACLVHHGIAKGDRIVHCFSGNSPYDLVLRLSAAMVGAVPASVNWQSDNEKRILYKIAVSRAKIIFFDEGFRERIHAIGPALKDAALLPVRIIETFAPPDACESPSPGWEDEKGIIFTSGTTGLPKGVILSHRSYLANRLTFEDYFRATPSLPLDLLLVNPLHHTNSSALSDWGMRRRHAVIHLVQRYSTLFWDVLAETAKKKRGLLVASLVPRHFDFLAELQEKGSLPLDEAELEAALSQAEILIGSAPVGPGTVKNVLRFSGRLPRVRFGSTETCLQVAAIPVAMTPEETMAAFEAGWNHVRRGIKTPGYYIGREHFPITQLMIVKAVEPDKDGYMAPCEAGEPGYLVVRGANLMTGYAGGEDSTSVFREGWYTGLRDMGFFLMGKDGLPDYYWAGRDSAMLIRGGANYSYEQVAEDLSRVLSEEFQIPPDQFKLAVVGIRAGSEHEDSCCVAIELRGEAESKRDVLMRDFVSTASAKVPKGCRPDFVIFGEIPCNFKGAVEYARLKGNFTRCLKSLE